MAMPHTHAKNNNNIIEDLKVSIIIPSVPVIALYSPVSRWSRLSACPCIACAAQGISWEIHYFPSHAILPCNGWEPRSQLLFCSSWSLLRCRAQRGCLTSLPSLAMAMREQGASEAQRIGTSLLLGVSSCCSREDG